ncbi:hypothetical protein EZS27_018050 [termite gut metagenome]|uniref:Uncharacterized protein n=1 Tax=termite gut metagenome TaxID=433724 RepID=A0A5J4RKA4_9ZZZZ
MGTCLKYCIVSAVLIMLLYSPAVKAAEVDYTIQTSFSSEHTYIVMQGRDGKQSVSFHDFFSSTLCDMIGMDFIYMPTTKSMLPSIILFKEDVPSANVSLYGVALHHSFIYVSDPVTHYVFGLRKIIV